MGIRFIVFLLAFTLLPQGFVFSADEKKSASEQEFCRLDKNNDQEITFEEFKACEFYKLEHVKALVYYELQEHGQKETTTLSDDDLKAYLFKKADKNKNNKIDRKEWEEFYNSLMDPGETRSQGHRELP